MDSNKSNYIKYFVCINFILFIWSRVIYSSVICSGQYPINSPYSLEEVNSNTIFSNFNEPPKHLDPARSYNENEHVFIAQIYEPPYQYHYLIRPYKLEPLTSDGYIKIEYFDNNNHKLPNTAVSKDISYTLYTVKIKPNIFYQPHPGFVKAGDQYVYHNLDKKFISKLNSISDFDLNKPNTVNTRELIATDFIYGIKRLADPNVQSPIYSLMAKNIVGLTELNQQLINLNNNNKYLDLNKFDLSGVKLIDKYTYQIKIKNKYPQFIYWFAMPFFAPIPWETDKFYHQPGLEQQNISLDSYPIGTGPYMMTTNNPNQKIILDKNPNYNHGFYPTESMPDDAKIGLLNKSGEKLPFINKAIYYLEKESIPIWNKFLQGYYDSAGISSDNFGAALKITNNQYNLSDEMISKNIKLIKTVEPSIFYWGFNMLDPIVGGYTEKQKKLRQAIGIAFNIEEYIKIFRNGRGQVAHNPIPPVVALDQNSQKDFNSYLYENKDLKKSLEQAKKLLAEAGYANGIDPQTGSQLILHFDSTSGDSEENTLFNWLREQFSQLNIKLHIRATQYNKFQEKMRLGQAQMFFWGWNADYPDPENFLFLFLCSQEKVKFNGENAANYCNPEFDKLFNQMQDENDITKKNIIIKQMINILQQDSPWIFGLYNEAYILQHGWNNSMKLLTIGNNSLKYRSIDYTLRVNQQILWNKTVYWPLFIFILLFIILLLPVFYSYYSKIYKPKYRV